MIIRFITILIFFLQLSDINAQCADCKNMLVLRDTIYHAGPLVGFGNLKEFDGNELTDTMVFEQEENSIWYLITAPSGGIFTFDILAKSKQDDWDFLLYEYKKMFCKRIEDDKIIPIRTNLSRSSVTGLSQASKESFVAAGVNSNYSKSVEVEKGEKFVLVVNNSSRSGGEHTLVLHFPKEKLLEKEVKRQKEELVKEVSTTKFELEVRDKLSRELVESNIIITGLYDTSIFIKNKASYVKNVFQKKRSVDVSIAAKGYMLYSHHLKVKRDRINFFSEIFLEPIVINSRVNLKQIQFYGNRADILPSARPSLEALLSFMKLNPTVVIEVRGHVNGPGQRNSKDYKELSTNRAFRVKAFLEKNGVDKERIEFKGYGNSRMLYSNPKSTAQQLANRRVEIKILSK